MDDANGQTKESKSTLAFWVVIGLAALDKNGNVAYEAVGGQDWSAGGVPKLAEELSHE